MKNYKPKITLSGFQSFLDIDVNPTETLIENLKLISFTDAEVKLVTLPVEFDNSFEVLKKEIEVYQPDVVLSMGVASQRLKLEFERIAINFRSSSNPDNLGFRPNNDSVIVDGPDGVFTNLNILEIVSDLKDKKIEIGISNSAGTYVCNSLMYKLCLHAKDNDYLAGFMHVPNNWPEELLLSSVLAVIDSLKKGAR